MKTLIKVIFALIFTLGCLTVEAQQSPMYTHYMYNTLVVNPGYAGSREALTVTALHRSQWVDFNGAPLTQTLTMHAPLTNEHIGLGLSVMNDKIGPVNNTSIFADFAFIMQMNEKSKLALGLSGGVNMFRANLSEIQLDQQLDPVFQNNIKSISPNFGFGVYFYRERFYAGVSTPDLLQNSYSIINQENGNSMIGKEQRHYFMIMGAMLNFSENFAFKPTALVKLTPAAPIQADLTASFVIMKRLLLGGMFRTGDAFGALVGIDITKQFHIGYSYDWSYGLETSKYNKGSHEVVLIYDFLTSRNKQIQSPRNF